MKRIIVVSYNLRVMTTLLPGPAVLCVELEIHVFHEPGLYSDFGIEILSTQVPVTSPQILAIPALRTVCIYIRAPSDS